MTIRGRLALLFFIVFTNLVGAGVVVPTLALYAEGQFGADAVAAALFVALYHLAQFVAAPLLGRLSDRIGRRPVLIWSQAGTLVAFGMFLAAPAVARYGLALLFAARLLDGLTGGNVTAAQAYVTDSVTPEQRARALGLIQVALALGLVFGPAIGGLLALRGLAAPYVAALVLTAVSLLATIVALPESLPPAQRSPGGVAERSVASAPAARPDTRIALILALSFTVYFLIAGISALFPLYAERVIFPTADATRVARNVGLMLAYVGVAAIGGQLLLLQRLVRRLGEATTIVLAIGQAAISCVALLLLSDGWLVTLALTPAALAYAIGIPAGQALLVRLGDAGATGRLLGRYHAVNSLANVVGPLVSGVLFVQVGPRAPFGFALALTIVALGLAFWLKARTI